ncbi:MAG: hypothetical protein HRT38_03155 [Alteromonadaceae bacterium]|nr:hypothetical protein [Alteromonadaceae bacterium]
MKYLLPLLLFFLGCQNPTLYVVQKGYSDKNISKLISEVELLGFNVKKSNISIPNEFSDSSIAMNPGFSDFSLLHKLNGVLTTLGYSNATEYRFAEGQHFYNKRILGLYLRKPGVSLVSDVPPYLHTQFCKYAEGTLQLTEQGTFSLEYENPAAKDDDLLVVSGTWFFNSDKLTLNSKATNEQIFIKTKEKKSTYMGIKPADVFKPQVQNHPFMPFNCEYLIIYME